VPGGQSWSHGTRGTPVAALRRVLEPSATRGIAEAALSREAGTTPPPPLPRRSVGSQGVVVPVHAPRESTSDDHMGQDSL
jgi:hypothetical protein